MPIKKDDNDSLRDLCHGLGMTLFGVASAAGLRGGFALAPHSVDRYDFVISLGKSLVDGVLEEIVDAPTALYFHHYRQINYFLDRAALLVASEIQDAGYNALPIAASQVIDWERQRGHISHKKAGEHAGLGWIGRNNLLVNPDLGARFRLVSILTDMPLVAGSRLQDDCGDCRECISLCPAQAIKERPEDFDHIACFEKLKEFRKRGIVSQYICGICVKSCRPLRSAKSRGGASREFS